MVLYLSLQQFVTSGDVFSFSSKLIGHLGTYQSCLGGEKQPGIRGNRRALTRILLVRDGDASVRICDDLRWLKLIKMGREKTSGTCLGPIVVLGNLR